MPEFPNNVRRAGERVRIATPLHALEIRERAATASAGPIATVCLIRAGLGNSFDRHWYTAQALEKGVADGLFEGKPAYLDHPSAVDEKVLPERSVTRLAGYFKNTRMGTDDGRPAILAEFVPEHGAAAVVDKLRTAVEYSKEFPQDSYIGFSIDAMGTGESAEIDGQTVQRVDAFTRVNSIDIVTKAGAGGRVISLVESARMGVALRTGFTPEQFDEIDDMVKTAVASTTAIVRRTVREAVVGMRRQGIPVTSRTLGNVAGRLLEKRLALTGRI